MHCRPLLIIQTFASHNYDIQEMVKIKVINHLQWSIIVFSGIVQLLEQGRAKYGSA